MKNNKLKLDLSRKSGKMNQNDTNAVTTDNVFGVLLDTLQDIRDSLDVIALYYERKGMTEKIIDKEDIEHE